MSSNQPVPVYEFGSWRFDPSARVLSSSVQSGDYSESQSITLSPKVSKLLDALVSRAGEAVSKNDLMDQLWPDCVVEESNLSENVFRLRRELGDELKPHRYIQTVHRVGYRFLPRVDERWSTMMSFEESANNLDEACEEFLRHIGHLSESDQMPPNLSPVLLNLWISLKNVQQWLSSSEFDHELESNQA
jgi:DNA-binding winged helix-turn-helix (wHTH) protein